jgi:hypothetical protein
LRSGYPDLAIESARKARRYVENATEDGEWNTLPVAEELELRSQHVMALYKVFVFDGVCVNTCAAFVCGNVNICD